MIRVLVAEDCIEQYYDCCKFLTKDKDIEIISRTVDAKSTIKEYLSSKPDILLLNLELPELNGIEVIDKLSLDIIEKKKCNIVITTGNDLMKQYITNASKIYKIFSKPYDYGDLISTIKEIGGANKELEKKKIKDFLSDFNINLYSRGARYIADAIQFAYNDIDLLSNVTELYKEVAILNNEKVNRIQRSIRSSIDIINSHISKEQLRSFFHIYNNDIITPKYFFTIVVDYFIELEEK